MKISYILKNKGSGYRHIAPDQPLTDAIKIMSQHRIGSLMVMEGGRLVSIVTERDVLLAVGSHGDSLSDVTVGKVMARQLIICSSDDTLDRAMDMMTNNATKKRIRHLPVVDDEVLVGVVSIGDVVDALLTKTRFENQLLKNYIKNWPEEE